MLRALPVPCLFAAVLALSGCLEGDTSGPGQGTLKVGILHSLTGSEAISEPAVVDGLLLAIEEINERGGVLGKAILPVGLDGESRPEVLYNQAEQLLLTDKVSVVFGCGTSESRRTVLPLFEQHDALLISSAAYEGIEDSPNVVHVGATPNQQITPAVKWCIDNRGSSFFLVGTDAVYSSVAHAIIREQVKGLRGAEVVGEALIPPGSSRVEDAVAAITETRPDMILSTLSGISNVWFFRALRKAGIHPDRIPTMSFTIGEEELRALDPELVTGDYAAWNYFQSIDTDTNRSFVAAFRSRFGSHRVVDDPMESAYVSVHLWKQAVEQAGTADPVKVRQALHDQSFDAPEGLVYLDSRTNHAWRTVRIGRIQPTGQFAIVWDSGKPVQPVPYPIYLSRQEWDRLVSSLQLRWGGRWAGTGD